MGRRIEDIWQAQKELQDLLYDYYSFPEDSISIFSYNMLLLLEEAGELLQADKRYRVENYYTSVELDESALNKKLEEIADLFIVCMNIAMSSGFDLEDVLQAVELKQKCNKIKHLT